MEKPIDQWFISTILATKNLSKKSSWISRPIELMTAEAISTGWWLSPLSPLKNMTSSVGKYIYILPIYGKIKAMFQTTKQINIQWHSHCIPSNFNIPPLLSHIFQVNPETTWKNPFIFHSYTIYIPFSWLYSSEDTTKAREWPHPRGGCCRFSLEDTRDSSLRWIKEVVGDSSWGREKLLWILWLIMFNNGNIWLIYMVNVV